MTDTASPLLGGAAMNDAVARALEKAAAALEGGEVEGALEQVKELELTGPVTPTTLARARAAQKRCEAALATLQRRLADEVRQQGGALRAHHAYSGCRRG